MTAASSMQTHPASNGAGRDSWRAAWPVGPHRWLLPDTHRPGLRGPPCCPWWTVTILAHTASPGNLWISPNLLENLSEKSHALSCSRPFVWLHGSFSPLRPTGVMPSCSAEWFYTTGRPPGVDSLGKRGCKAGCVLKNLNCCLCLHCPDLKPRRGANSRG